MIEYLEELASEHQYDKTLHYAEQLLLSKHNSPRDLVAINCAITTCRYYLKDYTGAVVAGQLAVKLAAECGLWDYYGVACLDLGVALMVTEQHQEAADVFYGYLANLSKYTAACEYEPKVWFNLGRMYGIMRDMPRSLHALRKALDAAIRVGNERYAHGIRQALADARIQTGQHKDIPRLLAQCGHYLRENLSVPDHRESRFQFVKLRIDYLLATNRQRRATAVALAALGDYEGEPYSQFFLHMQLARMAQRAGSTQAALGHAIACRSYAACCQQSDLEAQAVELTFELTTGSPPI